MVGSIFRKPNDSIFGYVGGTGSAVVVRDFSMSLKTCTHIGKAKLSTHL